MRVGSYIVCKSLRNKKHFCGRCCGVARAVPLQAGIQQPSKAAAPGSEGLPSAAVGAGPGSPGTLHPLPGTRLSPLERPLASRDGTLSPPPPKKKPACSTVRASPCPPWPGPCLLPGPTRGAAVPHPAPGSPRTLPGGTVPGECKNPQIAPDGASGVWFFPLSQNKWRETAGARERRGAGGGGGRTRGGPSRGGTSGSAAGENAKRMGPFRECLLARPSSFSCPCSSLRFRRYPG